MKRKPTSNAKAPTHDVFIIEGEGENAFWTKIGAGWPHADGRGVNIKLKCLPIDGRIAIRLKFEDNDAEVGQ
jgi:hypothetical protein